jgi:ubiquinone/menaquinone biosynthesis C-methylase UbiE
MERILEPELMDDERQSLAYARADFGASNQSFVDGLTHDFPRPLRSAVDIGCGPGDVDIRLTRAAPDLVITGVDGSAPMIALAAEAVRAARLEQRIRLVCARVPTRILGDHAFDAVLSKDLLHHLPDPSVLWTEVVRLGRPRAVVYVMDLVRPPSPEAARRIVDAAAGSEDPILQADFYNSLCAAFTVDEVRGQLEDAGLDLRVTLAGERHLLASGLLR